jgi:hypothetical protein
MSALCWWITAKVAASRVMDDSGARAGAGDGMEATMAVGTQEDSVRRLHEAEY